jgi:hypothetical protein
VLLGVVILGEHLVVRGVGTVVLVVAVGAMTVATIALGRDSASPGRAAETSGELQSARKAPFEA